MRRQQREMMGRKYERERRRKVGGGRKKRELPVLGKKIPQNQMTNEKLGEYLQVTSQIRDNLLKIS